MMSLSIIEETNSYGNIKLAKWRPINGMASSGESERVGMACR